MTTTATTFPLRQLLETMIDDATELLEVIEQTHHHATSLVDFCSVAHVTMTEQLLHPFLAVLREWPEPDHHFHHHHHPHHHKVAALTGRFIILLSDIHSLLQQLLLSSTTNGVGEIGGARTTTTTLSWVPPSSFERQTTKHWVLDDKDNSFPRHLSHVMAVAACEVPLLVFGSSSQTKQGLRLSQSFSPPAATATSIDVDIDINYDTIDDNDILWSRCATQITSVYLDRTVDMKFYNERLKRAEGAQLLRARWYGLHRPLPHEPIHLEIKTHHEAWIGTNSVKRRVTILARHMPAFLSTKSTWSRTEAEQMVREAVGPDSSTKKIEDAITLLLEMKLLVTMHKMRPCVRSTYSRIAFQSNQTNAVRFTVDRHVRLYDETVGAAGGASDRDHDETLTSINHGDWCLPDSALASAQHVVLPYAIFEVKLAGGHPMPESINNLIEMGVVVEAYKFSKYLSGAAAFQPVRTLPHWADHPRFQEMFQHRSSSSTIKTSANTDGGGGLDSSFAITTSMKAKDDPSSSEKPCRRRRFSPQSLLQAPSKPVRIQAIAPMKAARVEPKTFFANERTFIQWMSIALLLVTVDTLILDDGVGLVSRLKAAIMACAGALIVYCVSVYYYRLSLLSRGMPYGYTDRVGPAFLLIAVFFGGCILLIDTFGTFPDADKAFLSFIKEDEPGGCYRHPHGISPLDYQPSDIVVHGDRLLVPSLSQITAISKGKSLGATAATSLVTLPDTDIESITVVGDRVFVVAEGKKDSSLIELAWRAVNDTDGDGGVDSRLEAVGTWEVDLAYVEGLAYVTHDSDEPLLYFGDQQGFIHSSPVPAIETSGQTLSLKRLNQKVFLRGLLDPKIAALQYLDGILYILHDNAGIIRGWDMASGTMQSEWKLPVPPDSFGTADQIEGFVLEKRLQGSNLRGGLGGSGADRQSYLMHLAVDSPAQIWTLTVDVNTADHTITYPACARDAVPNKIDVPKPLPQNVTN
jgi:SPX domain protein involved in polyphosphate accumulation